MGQQHASKYRRANEQNVITLELPKRSPEEVCDHGNLAHEETSPAPVRQLRDLKTPHRDLGVEESVYYEPASNPGEIHKIENFIQQSAIPLVNQRNEAQCDGVYWDQDLKEGNGTKAMDFPLPDEVTAQGEFHSRAYQRLIVQKEEKGGQTKFNFYFELITFFNVAGHTPFLQRCSWFMKHYAFTSNS